MKDFYGIGGVTAAAIVLVAGQAASAAPTQVTNIRLNPSQSGVDVVLETQAGERAPQVFNVNRGNTWTAYIFNTQLRGNQPYQQNNPAPGIASIAVTPVGGNGIQVTVVGQGNVAPTGQIASRNAQGVVLSVSGLGGAPVAQAPALSVAQAPASSSPPPPIGVPITPLVPNPTITTTPPSVPISPVPPFLPRAVAPPVGDITIAPIDVSPSAIDLGSAERIPRLVLRDAPVREVLSLLARAAGLNLAYSESPSGQTGAAAGATRSGGPTISLDIENESVQDVFNYVLRLACVPVTGGAQGGGGQCGSLEATRTGRTIFVGTRLPNAARGAVARSLRLNQISVTSAVNFLVGLGAESAVTRERQVRTVVAQSASQLEGAPPNASSTTISLGPKPASVSIRATRDGVVSSSDRARIRRPGCSNARKAAIERPQNEITSASCCAQPRRAQASDRQEICGRQRHVPAGTAFASIGPTPKQNGSPEARATTGLDVSCRISGIAAPIGLGHTAARPVISDRAKPR